MSSGLTTGLNLEASSSFLVHWNPPDLVVMSPRFAKFTAISSYLLPKSGDIFYIFFVYFLINYRAVVLKLTKNNRTTGPLQLSLAEAGTLKAPCMAEFNL